MKRLIILVFVFSFSLDAWAGGRAEAASSSARGKYLAGRGIIVPPAEVHIDSYIARINYKYPDPAGDLGVNLYSGHYQVSTGGQEEVIHIGIQGKEIEFENLPPMNLAFVIDKSGSMNEQDKMVWVKGSSAGVCKYEGSGGWFFQWNGAPIGNDDAFCPELENHRRTLLLLQGGNRPGQQSTG
jgi:hypothetical protein